MTDTIQERAVLPELNNPVLISAFGFPQKGGATAAAALSYLVNEWDGKLVAEFDADDCYNFARIRPQLRRIDGESVVDWPTNEVYLVTPPGSDRSFLFLIGVEPSLQWRGFVQAIAEFADRVGVGTAVTLRSLPGAVTHTLPTPVQALYSDEELAIRFQVPQVEFTQAPLDIGALLSLQLQSLGCDTVDLFAFEPFYTLVSPDARAGLALLEALGGAFGLSMPVEQLTAAAEAQKAATDAAIEASEEMKAGIRALEESSRLLESDSGRLPEASAELDAGEALEEIEALLRNNRRAA